LCLYVICMSCWWSRCSYIVCCVKIFITKCKMFYKCTGLKQIRRKLQKVDCIVEVHDARISSLYFCVTGLYYALLCCSNIMSVCPSSRLYNNILAYPYQTLWQYSWGFPITSSAGGVWKYCDILPIYCFISKMIQNMAIVTVENCTQAFDWYPFSMILSDLAKYSPRWNIVLSASCLDSYMAHFLQFWHSLT